MNAQPSLAPTLEVSAGSGILLDPTTGEIKVDLEALNAGVDCTVTAKSADGVPLSAYRVTVAEIPLVRGGTTKFDAPAKLDELTFLGTAAPQLTLGAGFARLVPSVESRAHGAWAKAGGDGLYRCLFRLAGGLPPAFDRRFCLGARIRLEGANWHGIRVEIFETGIGQKRLHIRDYTGAGSNIASLATKAVIWEFDVWQWLEMEVNGSSVRGRVYAETASAPGWQVEATTSQLTPGAFGPGGLPYANLAPQIDIRVLEFVAA